LSRFYRTYIFSDARFFESKSQLAHERLYREYSCPIPYFHKLAPLSELVSSLLSHRTKNADSSRAFQYVRDAETSQIKKPFSPCAWPEQKVLEAQLPADGSAQQVYDNREVLMLHRRRACFFYNPNCAR
jgi:hypothetical protein